MSAGAPEGFGEEQASLEELTEENELFEMANLYPRTTGLPMTVWVSPRGGARHDARIKVCRVPGDRMVIRGSTVVGIRPTPTVLEGDIGASEFRAVAQWIDMNQEVLIAYRNGAIDTAELIQQLKRI
jgi:hypothetical protein